MSSFEPIFTEAAKVKLLACTMSEVGAQARLDFTF